MFDQEWMFIDFEAESATKEQESQLESAEQYEFLMCPADGLQIGDDQYIIDPDYMDKLEISNFEDLIRNKR